MNPNLLSIFVTGLLLCGCAVHRSPHSGAEAPQTGADEEILQSLSPALTELLSEYPAAETVLRDACSAALQGKRVRLYYFYSNNSANPRAYHFYRGPHSVNIAVRGSQHRWDEYISILYEVVNSDNEASLSRIAWEAERGKIRRTDFPRKVLEIEHRAVIRTRDLVKALGLSDAEVHDSELHQSLLESPDEFEDFLVYIQNTAAEANPVREYERQFDENVR